MIIDELPSYLQVFEERLKNLKEELSEQDLQTTFIGRRKILKTVICIIDGEEVDEDPRKELKSQDRVVDIFIKSRKN